VWLYAFGFFALVVLFVMGPKYTVRREKLQQNFEARNNVWKKQLTDPEFRAETRQGLPAVAGSDAQASWVWGLVLLLPCFLLVPLALIAVIFALRGRSVRPPERELDQDSSSQHS